MYDAQLKAVTDLRDACHWWASPGIPENLPDPIAPRKSFLLRRSLRVSNPPVLPMPPLPPPRVQTSPLHKRSDPRVDPPIVNHSPPPKVAPKTKRPIDHETVAKRTRSNTALIYNPIALRTRAPKKLSHSYTSPRGHTLLPTGPVSTVMHANPGNSNARIRCRNGKNIWISTSASASQI